MNGLKVKEIMIPIEDYPAIDQGASLHDAVMVLVESQKHLAEHRYKNRMLLVKGESGTITGKLDELDLVVGLEDGYRKIGDRKGIRHSGFSIEFIEMMMSQHRLWQRPLTQLCRKSEKIKVESVMEPLVEGEYIPETGTLDLAIHQFVMGEFRVLLVTSNGGVIGVLRFSDVLDLICEKIKSCETHQGN